MHEEMQGQWPAADRSEPRRESIVDQLGSSIDSLHKELSALEQRLRPVLRNVEAERAMPSILAEAGQSRLADMNGQVVHARLRVTDMLSELDL